MLKGGLCEELQVFFVCWFRPFKDPLVIFGDLFNGHRGMNGTFELEFVSPFRVGVFGDDGFECYSPVIVVSGGQAPNACHATAGLNRVTQATVGNVVEESQGVQEV